jgi:hypothetical protein
MAMMWIVYRVIKDKRSSNGKRLRAIGWVRAPIEASALSLAHAKFGSDLSVEEMEGYWGWFV